jgi:asparagine synthase (glutamine-hydrolysing)
MAHRGPDGVGLWISADRRIGLAHRRLAIIDLSEAANQPMHSVDRLSSIVFNGEIYNHAAIRQELESLGTLQWGTNHSDTEVILNAFRVWGAGAFSKLRGMFAFALWDHSRSELWLVRDRMGVKPLYFAQAGGKLVFASEIKAILADPDVRVAVDKASLEHYLSFIATPGPSTLFEGISKLQPGHLIVVRSNGTIERRRWYDLLDGAAAQPDLGEVAARGRLIDTLREAVRLRKVSDVPVGVFLSGGIDSSTNVALFAEDASEQVRTFSVAYDREYDSNPSELPFARLVSHRFETEHYERLLSVGDLIDFLPTMVRLQDEPIADPVCVPLYFLSRLARDHGVIVCQVGEGADELFFGYENWITKWRLQRLLRTYRADAWAAPTLVRMADVTSIRRSKAFDALSRVSHAQPLFWGTTEAFTSHEKSLLLGDAGQASEVHGRTWDVIRPFWDRFRASGIERSWGNWMTYIDFSLRIPELLLMRVDKMTMGASLEGREPFLDHELVELVLSLPEELKIHGGQPKRIFKQAVRGLIPDAVIDRRKQGFGVPVAEWFAGELGTTAHREVMSFASDSGLLRVDGIQAVIQGPSDPRLWYLYNLALWWREHFT